MDRRCGFRSYQQLKDHAQSDQHTHAMQLLKKEQGRAAGLRAASYAPIAQALSKLPADERDRLKKKFDIAYFVATEKLAFTKYPSICELEAQHGVELGTSYLNKSAGRTFCHYIAKECKENVVEALRKAHFFSILMDRTTDKGNIEDELFLVLWCDVDGEMMRRFTPVPATLQWTGQRMLQQWAFLKVIFVLATHGWQKIIDEEEKSETEGTDGKDVLEPLDRLAKWFRTPLEAAGANLSQLQKEFMEMLQYANQFISLVTLDYKVVWWRLFHAPSATE